MTAPRKSPTALRLKVLGEDKDRFVVPRWLDIEWTERAQLVSIKAITKNTSRLNLGHTWGTTTAEAVALGINCLLCESQEEALKLWRDHLPGYWQWKQGMDVG